MSGLTRRLSSLESRVRPTQSCSTCRGVEREPMVLCEDADGSLYPSATWTAWGSFALIAPIHCPLCGRSLDLKQCRATLSLSFDTLPEATLRKMAAAPETSKT